MRAIGPIVLLATVVLTPASALADGPTATEVSSKADVVFAETLEAYKVGRVDVETPHRWSVRILSAKLVDAGPAVKKTALRQHLDRMRKLAEVARKMAASGRSPQLDTKITEYFVAEAELWLSLGTIP